MEELFYNHMYLMEINLLDVGSYVISVIAGVISIITLYIKTSSDSKTKIKLAEIEAESRKETNKVSLLENNLDVHKKRVLALEEKATKDDTRIQELELKTKFLLEDLAQEKAEVQRKDTEITKLLERITHLENRLDNLTLKN